MFGKTKIIIAITDDKIVGAKVSSKKVERTVEFGWKLETLDLVLSKIKANLKAKKVRILIGDKLSYVLRLKVPAGLGNAEERRLIAKKISEQIPEKLADSDWDYKELRFKVAKENQDKAEKEVVVFSPVKGFFQKLSEALEKLELQVEAIEPEAIAKTRNSNPLVGLAMKKDIRGKDKDVLNLKTLEIGAVDEELESEELESEELLIDEARRMEKEKGSEDVSDESKASRDDAELRKPKLLLKKKFLLAIFSLLVLIGAFALVYLYFPKLKTKVDTPQSSQIEERADEVSELEELDSATKAEKESEEENLSEYSIQVQNGSGIVGEAGVVEEILMAEGFTNIQTSDADSYDYTDTEIKLKEQVSGKVYETLDRALNSDYSLKRSDSFLGDDSDFDVVVIVGQKLNE